MSGAGADSAGCGNCGGNCCRSYRVRVHAADVRRLAEGTGMRPEDFIWLVESDKSGFRLRPGGPTMDLHLQRRSSGACVLLLEIAPGRARCGVYAHRPLVCSNFPTMIRAGAVTVRQDTVCGGDAWNLTAMDLPGLRAGHIRDAEGWQEYERLTEAWNAAIDADGTEVTPAELFDHIMRTPADA